MGGGNYEYSVANQHAFTDHLLTCLNNDFDFPNGGLVWSEAEKSSLEEAIKKFAEYLHSIDFQNNLTDKQDPLKPEQEMAKFMTIFNAQLEQVIPDIVIEDKKTAPSSRVWEQETTSNYKKAIKAAYAHNVILAVNQYLKYESKQITYQQIINSERSYTNLFKSKISNEYTLTECGSDGSCAIHSYVAALRHHAVTATEGPEQDFVYHKLSDWGVGITRTEDHTNKGSRRELTQSEILLFRKRLVELLKEHINPIIDSDDGSLKLQYLTDVRNEANSNNVPEDLRGFDNYYNSILKVGTFLRDQELAVIAKQDEVNIHVIKDNGSMPSLRPNQSSSIDITLHNIGVCHFKAYIKNMPPVKKLSEEEEELELMLKLIDQMQKEEDEERRQNISWVEEYQKANPDASWSNKFKLFLASVIEWVLFPFKFIVGFFFSKPSQEAPIVKNDIKKDSPGFNLNRLEEKSNTFMPLHKSRERSNSLPMEMSEIDSVGNGLKRRLSF